MLISRLLNRRNKKVVTRLEKFLHHAPDDDKPREEETTVKRIGLERKIMAGLGKRFAGKSVVEYWEKRLDEAALPLKVEEFLGLRLLSAVGALFVAVIFEVRGILLLAALIMGYLLPRYYIQRRKEKRVARCSPQLAIALGTMATAMRAGFSFMQAMQLVGREMPDPLGPEFDRTLREINFGVPVEEALHHLLERLPDTDLELVVTALLVQRSTGGNLSEILESMQETIHERVRIKEELHALTAQGRLSAWIISLLPIALGFFLNLMNPEYFRPILTEPLGWLLLGVGTISGFIGWVAIRKIVRIEV